jgi:hypothetical protein
MPRDKLKPKDFEDYRKGSGERLEDYESGLTPERPEPLEGDFLRSPRDVSEDYWNDIDREKRENPPKPRHQRPLKNTRKLIKKWDSRKARRNASR